MNSTNTMLLTALVIGEERQCLTLIYFMWSSFSPITALVCRDNSRLINTHGRKGIKRLILGSVTEKVIQGSPCAVLALKP
ncbi:MAG: universal stress protein [Ignavibacteriales bacterium]